MGSTENLHRKVLSEHVLSRLIDSSRDIECVRAVLRSVHLVAERFNTFNRSIIGGSDRGIHYER